MTPQRVRLAATPGTAHRNSVELYHPRLQGLRGPSAIKIRERAFHANDRAPAAARESKDSSDTGRPHLRVLPQPSLRFLSAALGARHMHQIRPDASLRSKTMADKPPPSAQEESARGYRTGRKSLLPGSADRPCQRPRAACNLRFICVPIFISVF